MKILITILWMLGDVVVDAGKATRRGKGDGAGSSTPAATAGFAADAGSEVGGVAEWQMVTRGEARAGGAEKTAVKVVSSATHQGEGPQQAALTFEAASAAERKREAEEGITIS